MYFSPPNLKIWLRAWVCVVQRHADLLKKAEAQQVTDEKFLPNVIYCW